jgi:hypothetical protein
MVIIVIIVHYQHSSYNPPLKQLLEDVGLGGVLSMVVGRSFPLCTLQADACSSSGGACHYRGLLVMW